MRTPIQEVLKNTGISSAYSHFKKDIKPPFLVYIGSGQSQLLADNTVYKQSNEYQIEYYFTEKNEEKERKIEKTLLDAGYIYSKSSDVFIKEQNVFVIYYQVN